jgi:BA14K-like protein
MFSTSKGMIASTPDSGGGMARTQLRTGLCASALLLAGLTIADPALARSPYDGAWSVTVMTRGGACEPTSRYGVQISNGIVTAGGGGAAVQGRVSPGGGVNVSVQSGGQWANGAGHLNLARGSGVWRGQGSAGACRGTWVAQRESGMQAAEAQGMERPIYNFAPEGMGPPGAAACAARFRSYDPATGTFMGFDGMRHPCP